MVFKQKTSIDRKEEELPSIKVHSQMVMGVYVSVECIVDYLDVFLLCRPKYTTIDLRSEEFDRH